MKKGRISAARKALAIAVAIGSALLCAWPMNSAASASSSQDQRLGGRARPVITLQWPQFFGAGNEKSRDSAPRVLIPGGQAIGVAIRTQGVLVVGAGDNGRDSLREGDMILSVNGVPLLESAMLTEAVNAAQGQPLSLRISRGGQENDLLLTPRYDESSRAWRLGVWVRDSTAGVGTLTYYDPATGAYGALGHAITDSDTGSLLPVREGALMQAEIVDVRRGQRGAPGELRGSFLREQVTLGTVQVNTALGIYGRLEAPAASALAWPVDRMPVYSEGPMQAAICTNVVEIATPNGFISGGSVRRPAVCDGENTKPVPPMTSSAATNTAGSESVGARPAIRPNPTAMTAKPAGSSGHSPRASMIRPPRSVVPAFASTGISITMPAINAVRPVPLSRYSGSSTLQLSRSGQLEGRFTDASAAHDLTRATRRYLRSMDFDIAEIFEPVRLSAGVYSVTAPIEMTKTFVEIQQAVTKVGRGVVLVLMAVSIITVGTTIRLSVFARRREIEIMKYVGATNALVTLPFVIEGLTMGLLSGILTAAATIGGYAYIVQLAPTLGGLWQMLMGTALVPLENVWPTILTYSLASGALVGGLGSMFSIRKHLNV